VLDHQGTADVPGSADKTRPDKQATADVQTADSAGSKTKRKVLFVGNSYTFGLPAWVAKVAAATKPPPLIDAVEHTQGGATMKMHFDSAATLAKIASGGWDYVVLQGQSVEPVYNPTEFAKYSGYLAAKVKQAGAKVVFFETWARAKGHAVYKESWSGGNPTAMQAGLRNAYQAVAKSAGGVMARVGDAWQYTLQAHPSITLFAPDGSHPTENGTYLAACVFYTTLTGLSPIGIADKPAGLSAADAKALQSAAYYTVKPK